jgi:hypothetical protein
VPRQRTSPETLPEIFVVPPNGVMRLATVGKLMGIRGIGREVRAGRLRVHKIANRYYCLGCDILEWIQGAPSFGRGEHMRTNGSTGHGGRPA